MSSHDFLVSFRPLLLVSVGLIGACGGDPADPTPATDAATSNADATAGDDATEPGDDTGALPGDAGGAGVDTAIPDDAGECQTPNACGGCAPLEEAPGDPCGPCLKDQLACAPDGLSLVCAGATPCCGTNADCNVGEHCDAGECFPGLCPEAERNACDGCTALTETLGAACGPCLKDQLVCGADATSLICSGETPCSAPTVTTGEVTAITQFAATLQGALTALGDRPVTAHGFCRSVSGIPARDDGVSSCSDLGPKAEPGPFSEAIAELPLGSPFVVRAYAVTEAGVGYGETLAWRTADAVLPVVETVSAEGLATEGALRVTARLDVVGIPQNTGRGVCLGTATGPALGDEASTCEELGATAEPGPFTVTYEGLAMGATYHVRAYVLTGEGALYGSEKTVTLRPTAPTIANISFRTDVVKVVLSWEAVPGATGYHVYRDGVALTPAPVVASVFEDASATAGGSPTNEGFAPTATTNDSAKVTLTWSPPEVRPGPTHVYTVSALNAAGESARSAPRDGARAPQPITGYEVSINGGNAIPVVATTHDDLTAPPGSLSQANASASQGTSSAAVNLSLTGADALPGPTVNYRVRARNAAGAGPDSDPFQGARAAANVTLVWQRSADVTDASYGDIAGATTRSHSDTGAPANGAIRFYRARITAGGTTVTTAGVSGFRGVNLPELTVLTPANMSQTGARLLGRVASLGSATTLTAHGYCWATTQDPMWASGSTNCASLGTRSTTGDMGGHNLSGLTAGTRYFVRVFGVFDKSGTAFTAYSPNYEFVTVPATPAAPTVTRNDPLKVTVSWPRAANVTSYDVLRNGAVIASVTPTALTTQSHADTAAPAPALPAMVPTLAIGEQLCAVTAVNWTAPAAPTAGADATYTIIARNASGPSPASPGATGNRAAAPITGYTVTNLTSGRVLTLDVNARTTGIQDLPLPTVTAGTMTATDSASAHPDHVLLTSTGASKSAMPSASVRVRAISAVGNGAARDISVSRNACELAIRWQRATATLEDVGGRLVWTPGTFSDIAGAYGVTFQDYGAPATGEFRYYRARVFVAYGESQAVYTNQDLGNRYASAPAVTLSYLWQTTSGTASLTGTVRVSDLGTPNVGQNYGLCVTSADAATVPDDRIRPGIRDVNCKSAAEADNPAAVSTVTYTFRLVATDGLVRGKTWRGAGYARNAWTERNATSTGGYKVSPVIGVYLN